MTDTIFRTLERKAAQGDTDAKNRLERARQRANQAIPGFEHFMNSRILLLGARWHYDGILVRCEGHHLILTNCRQIFNYTKEQGVSAADDLPGETTCNADHVSATCLSFFKDRDQVRGNTKPNLNGPPIPGYAHLMGHRVLLLGARWHYDGDLVGCAGDQLLLRNCRMIFNYTLEEGISASDTLEDSSDQDSSDQDSSDQHNVAVSDVKEGIVSCNWNHVASASISPFSFDKGNDER